MCRFFGEGELSGIVAGWRVVAVLLQVIRALSTCVSSLDKAEANARGARLPIAIGKSQVEGVFSKQP